MSSSPLSEERSASFAGLFDAICTNIGRAVRGKEQVVRLTVTSLVAQGHLLLEDVPGVGKTSIAKAVAKSVDGHFARVQCTPDLLPSDVLGTSVWNQHDGSFEFRSGPVFANLLLADEINRASPKTQSALLEAMAEEQVTVDGSTYQLPKPFMVIATENPLEHHGTFPLPESQLDRFLMKLSVGYPSKEAERALIREPDHDSVLSTLPAVASSADIIAMGSAAQQLYVADSLTDYLVELAAGSRKSPLFDLGISPRALLGLLRAARVWAAAEGRNFVTPDDFKALAGPVLAHRVVLSSQARLAGLEPAAAIEELIRSTSITN
ncbi:MAG: MoxR family ATPase [Actinomycetes bacterium]